MQLSDCLADVIFEDFIPTNYPDTYPDTFTHWEGCLRLRNISDYDDSYFQELCNCCQKCCILIC